MVKDFIGGVSNIPNQLKGQNVLIPTGYGTAATNQGENFVVFNFVNETNWETIYTVPTGKTFYISTILSGNISDTTNRILEIGISSSTIIHVRLSDTADTTPRFHQTFPIPLKFTSGTVIQGKVSDHDDVPYITLIGWEE